MSELRDFIKANMLDHDETFCVEHIESSDIRIALRLSNIPHTCWQWQKGMPKEMDAQYKEPKFRYALFTGPFTKESAARIAELASTDPEVIEEHLKKCREADEDSKHYVDYDESWG